MRAAAFFDLDKTILASSSSLVFTRPLYKIGMINRADVLRSAYRQFVFTIGSADHDQTEKMREYLSQLVTGWKVEELRSVVMDSLDDLVTPTVHAEALELIQSHQAAGRDVVIVSASGSEIVGPIANLLGVDHAIGTEMEVQDGRYTGEISFYAYAHNKAVAMQEYAAEHDIDLATSYAYSDSLTDLPMLEVVGNPVVVNPDSALRTIATERGWPVLTFERPAALRRPLIDDPKQQKQALLLAGFIALFIAWRLRARRQQVA